MPRSFSKGRLMLFGPCCSCVPQLDVHPARSHRFYELRHFDGADRIDQRGGDETEEVVLSESHQLTFTHHRDGGVRQEVHWQGVNLFAESAEEEGRNKPLPPLNGLMRLIIIIPLEGPYWSPRLTLSVIQLTLLIL